MHLCARMYRGVFIHLCVHMKKPKFDTWVSDVSGVFSLCTFFLIVSPWTWRPVFGQDARSTSPRSACLHPASAGITGMFPSFVGVLETWTQTLLLVLEALFPSSHLANLPMLVLTESTLALCLSLESHCWSIYMTFTLSKTYQFCGLWAFMGKMSREDKVLEDVSLWASWDFLPSWLILCLTGKGFLGVLYEESHKNHSSYWDFNTIFATSS